MESFDEIIQEYESCLVLIGSKYEFNILPLGFLDDFYVEYSKNDSNKQLNEKTEKVFNAQNSQIPLNKDINNVLLNEKLKKI